MKVDWKEFAASEGYKKLKAAYIYDARDASKTKFPMRKKAELYKTFQHAITMAIREAHIRGVSPSQILNAWEQKRTFWYLNYYNKSNIVSNTRNTDYPITFVRKLKYSNKPNKIRGYQYAELKNKLIKLRENKKEIAQHQRRLKGKKPKWHALKKKHHRIGRKIAKSL